MKSPTQIIQAFLILLWMLTVGFNFAQVQDDFSDGDFTNNPTWIDDENKFTVSTGMLKLQAPAVIDTSSLAIPSEAIHNASWEFYVRMGFATSSTSLSRVYLTSNKSDLRQALNGYFVMIGNTSDEVSLYKQTGTTIVRIIDGSGSVNFSNVMVKVKVTRDATGNWSLYADTSSTGPTGTYTFKGDTIEQTHTSSSFFGVYCKYIASRSALFWFDDFVVTGTPLPDLTPPSLTSVESSNQNSVLVNFSEEIESTTAQTISNYALNNNAVVSTATLQADGKSVVLESTSFTNGFQYTLQVSGVQDLDGNTMLPASLDFFYFIPLPVKFKDIIVSELMADPSPVIGLPESEFIEIFNRSVNPIDLQGWKLSDGTTTATLPKKILLPSARLVITSTSTSALFTNAVGVSNFPSLNNSGDNVIVKNASGTTIDSITYSQSWYHSDEKKDGGWSLEIIDPENLCEEDGNWTASENVQGGTPGSQNSVFANNPDLTEPIAQSAVIIDAVTLEIFFNEKLDGNASIAASASPEINFPVIQYLPSLKEIELTASTPFQPGVPYVLTLSNVFDCSGNPSANSTLNFILPQAAEPNDICINEILFNPKSGGVDFVEIYNKSDKHISLKNWALANFDGSTAINPKTVENESLIIPPKSFLVFTTEPSTLKAHYPRTIESVCTTNMLPSLPDDEGSIALVDSLGNVMDAFLYNDSYHVIFLKDKEGVSLERVSLEAPTNDANNWRSASEAENFATPGYKNSASSNGSSAPEGEVMVDPEIFSPQVAPTEFTKISYRFNQSGHVANAYIFDQQGHVIKILANNEVLGTEGFFRWDGDRDDGGRARAGYYVAWVEVFDGGGQVNTFKKRVVVAFR